MKNYFAKYLPVEGEIKEGDWVLYANSYFFVKNINNIGLLVTESDGDFRLNKSYCKKVKLFLCSRDIEVGDEIISPIKGSFGVVTEILSKFQCNTHKYKCIEMTTGCFKTVGEILTPNIKEGQEFTEKEIEYLTIES